MSFAATDKKEERAERGGGGVGGGGEKKRTKAKRRKRKKFLNHSMYLCVVASGVSLLIWKSFLSLSLCFVAETALKKDRPVIS